MDKMKKSHSAQPVFFFYRGEKIFRKGLYILVQKKFPKRKKTNTYKQKKFSKQKKGLFCLRNLEIFGTICMLSLAIVVFSHVVQWNTVGQSDMKKKMEQKSQIEQYQILPAEEGPCGRPEIIQNFIEQNPYSRSGISLDSVNGVVVHYVANPGSTAEENRNYFENLKDTHLTKASSHYIIGLDGEIIQCIPLDEISYASNDRNADTISIECCHPDKSGKFNKKTYHSLIKLTAWLCASYGLSVSDIIRHYDVTGKMCPKYYVKHEDAWNEILSDVENKLGKK